MEFFLSEKNDTICGKYSVAGRTFQWQQIAVLGRKISQATKIQIPTANARLYRVFGTRTC